MINQNPQMSLDPIATAEITATLNHANKEFMDRGLSYSLNQVNQ